VNHGHRELKDAVYEQVARVSKAAAAPKRLELLDLLSQGPRTVEVLADLAGITVGNASQHLKVLRAARLVDAERLGLHVEYRLADEEVERFFLALRALARSRLAEIELVTRQFRERRGELEAVEGEELVRRVRGGEVTVLDVRPAEEFAAGHIPGARSIPVGDLAKRLNEVPRNREVIAYCRGPYCVMAIEAVELLRRKGYTASRMEHGVADWRARGWRVEVSDERRRPRSKPRSGARS
jgi:rhodanese-related sulfurtransferase/DNA-binding transcriptional ArsR family regulator